MFSDDTMTVFYLIKPDKACDPETLRHIFERSNYSPENADREMKGQSTCYPMTIDEKQSIYIGEYPASYFSNIVLQIGRIIPALMLHAGISASAGIYFAPKETISEEGFAVCESIIQEAKAFFTEGTGTFAVAVAQKTGKRLTFTGELDKTAGCKYENWPAFYSFYAMAHLLDLLIYEYIPVADFRNAVDKIKSLREASLSLAIRDDIRKFLGKHISENSQNIINFHLYKIAWEDEFLIHAVAAAAVRADMRTVYLVKPDKECETMILRLAAERDGDFRDVSANKTDENRGIIYGETDLDGEAAQNITTMRGAFGLYAQTTVSAAVCVAPKDMPLEEVLTVCETVMLQAKAKHGDGVLGITTILDSGRRLTACCELESEFYLENVGPRISRPLLAFQELLCLILNNTIPHIDYINAIESAMAWL